MSPHAALAGANADAAARFIKAVDGMMVDLGPTSARSAATINDIYRHHLELLVLQEYAALEGALGNGGLVPLPTDPVQFNVKPRVDGPAPIGEKDLDNQTTYLAARPAALGALFEIASRVTSGPVEVTSLVRHSEYQEELRKTNRNAHTSVPTHTMGLAFDIALINTRLETIYEIRDVLTEMQAAGDILVIGERRQLVFHIVPHPTRLGYFTDVYARRVAGALPGANVVPAVPVVNTPGPARPAVSADIVAFSPTEAFADEWWAAGGAHAGLVVEVVPARNPTPSRDIPTLTRDSRSFFGRIAAGLATVFGKVVAAVHRIAP